MCRAIASAVARELRLAGDLKESGPLKRASFRSHLARSPPLTCPVSVCAPNPYSVRAQPRLASTPGQFASNSFPTDAMIPEPLQSHRDDSSSDSSLEGPFVEIEHDGTGDGPEWEDDEFPREPRPPPDVEYDFGGDWMPDEPPPVEPKEELPPSDAEEHPGRDAAGRFKRGQRRPRDPVSTSEIDKALALVHRNMGHPSARELQRLLSASGATALAIERVPHIRCDTCSQLVQPKLARPAKTLSAKVFNEVVGIDCFWLADASGHKYPCLNCVDWATRCQVCYPLPSLKPRHVLKILT